MKMKACLVLSILTAGMTFAQTSTPAPSPRPHLGRGPGMGAPRDFETRLAQNLGLNAQQQNTVHTAMAESRLSMQGLRQQRQTLEGQLTAAIKSGDETQIEKVTQQIGALHQQEVAIHAKTTAKIYAALSADQKAKVGPNLEVLRGGPMGGRRPGPPPAQPAQQQ